MVKNNICLERKGYSQVKNIMAQKAIVNVVSNNVLYKEEYSMVHNTTILTALVTTVKTNVC
jgi:hypothetical protein